MTNNIDELASLPFRDSNLDIEERVEDLLSRLTFDEKITLSYGKRIFWTRPIKRLGIPSFKMTDGPHGVGTGIYFLKKMTYFPVAICRAATWNLELSKQFGEALAEETRSVGRHMILAPGINIQRTPLNGRNFEYQTEDPYLNSKTVVAMVNGVQSRRIATCVKHFAANNQEYNRFKSISVVSERALQEIYYPGYKASVEEADAWGFMACYNQLNGTFGCEHYGLVRETLMNLWGFRGFVVSDWFATRFTKTGTCVKAGLSLEMPFKIVYKAEKLKESFEKGEYTEEEFDDNIKRLLRVFFLTGLFDEESKIPLGSRNTHEHQSVAKEVAEEGIVLLKNENNLLPLDNGKVSKIAILGPNANKKLGFGGGSSQIRPKYEVTPLKGIKAKCKERKIKVVKSAAKADVAIVCAGLDHSKYMDRENKDRLVLELPQEQTELIQNTIKENANTVVVLINGSPVGMDGWVDIVPSIVEAWYAGQEAGNAIANILFGEVNPSGKLPLTFPKNLKDSPAHKSLRTYPGLKGWDLIKEGDVSVLKGNKGYVLKADFRDEVHYDEGIYVGYRHFDTNNIEPLFPFGHGLSYTTFKYDNLKLSTTSLSGSDMLKVSIDISNTGRRAGAEVVQLYVQDVECTVDRPIKELKGFNKVFLEAGQKTTIEFELNKNDLSFYSESEKVWKAENGEFKIHIGSSSRDIRLEGSFNFSN